MTMEVLLKAVTVEEAENHFDELLDLAELGEQIVITQDGKEVGRLVPPRHYETEPDVAKRGFGQ